MAVKHIIRFFSGPVHRSGNLIGLGIGERPAQTSYVARFFTRNKSLMPIEQKQIRKDKDYDYKQKLISLLNFQTPEDSKPFYKLPVKTLLHIYKTTSLDQKNGFCKNRIYYLSKQLKCPPSLLGEYIVKRTFVYSLSFQWIKSSLEVLLEMNVPTDRILRDLWVLKYNHNTIRQRLQRVKDLGVDTLYPWMVRCSEEILEGFIETALETKTILGNDKSTLIYLADRLNITPEEIEKICYTVPSIKTIRAKKLKHFIDFLINEGFTNTDISRKARILSASPKTVKQRLELLRELGLEEINLNVLCRSRKDFNRYIASIEAGNKE